MKILILSCNTGEGHNSASRALKEEFDSFGIECEIKDTLSFASKKISDYISNIYIQMALKAPNMWGKIYNAGKNFPRTRAKSPVYYANSLYSERMAKYINKNDFDVLVMPHLYPGEAATYLRKRGKIKAKLYMVATDYAPCPFFEEVEVDRYFIPHADLVDDYVERGIERDQLIVSGIPVSRRFNNRLSKDEARKKVGLPEGKKIALIMTGSMGFGNTKTISDKLLRDAPDMLQIILGGNNEDLKATLRKEYLDKENIRILDFTKEVPVYMDACDILFTKPGGLTSTEACVKNIPLVHTAPIPGNEIENAEFFRDHGLSIYNEDTERSVREAVALLNDPELTRKMIMAQDTQINADAAMQIAKYIIDDNT